MGRVIGEGGRTVFVRVIFVVFVCVCLFGVRFLRIREGVGGGMFLGGFFVFRTFGN